MSTTTDVHTPWPVLTDVYENVGGAPVYQHQELQLRCGCRDDLLWDYGHNA